MDERIKGLEEEKDEPVGKPGAKGGPPKKPEPAKQPAKGKDAKGKDAPPEGGQIEVT
jgi:hypothetical protein